MLQKQIIAFINKGIILRSLYLPLFFVFMSLCTLLLPSEAFATILAPAPARIILDRLLAVIRLLIVFGTLFFFVQIIEGFFDKSKAKKKIIKERIIFILKLLVFLVLLYLISHFFYFPTLKAILGEKNDFFAIDVVSCNSWMGCPSEPIYDKGEVNF